VEVERTVNPLDGNWDDAPQLSRAEIDAVLADPATWLQSPDTHENIRMISVLTTDHADRLIAERTPAPGGDSLPNSRHRTVNHHPGLDRA